MISLEHGFAPPAAPKEFTTTAPAAAAPAVGPTTEKEYQDAYHALRKEVEDLRNAVATRDVRIVQLEAQLQAAKQS